jgi:hypothetical protein
MAHSSSLRMGETGSCYQGRGGRRYHEAVDHFIHQASPRMSGLTVLFNGNS